MTFTELHKILGERILVTLDKSLTKQQRDEETKKTMEILAIAKYDIAEVNAIIRNEEHKACNNLVHSAADELIGINIERKKKSVVKRKNKL
jgi:hypothetical protein